MKTCLTGLLPSRLAGYDCSANGVKTVSRGCHLNFAVEKDADVTFSFGLLVEKLQLPSLHFVGFLAHAIKIEDFSSTCSRLQQPLLYTKFTLTRYQRKEIRMQVSNPDASKVLVCKWSFVSMQQIISKRRSLIERNLFIIILGQ